jgi:hypothetical protein
MSVFTADNGEEFGLLRMKLNSQEALQTVVTGL